MGRIINIGFNHLTDAHVHALDRAGLLRTNIVEDKNTALPYINKWMSPEVVRETMRKAVEDAKITSSDIVVFSGVPDACVYLVEILDESVKPHPPPILVPFGGQGKNGFKLLGFREIIRGNSEKLHIHIFSAKESEE